MSEIQVVLPEGRLVQGHTVEKSLPRDDQGKTIEGGSPYTFFAVAIPKGSETDWKQTSWGAQFLAQAMEAENGWPNGEFNRPDFSWKVINGDDTIPNKAGNIPTQNEGFPNHWIIRCQTNFDVPTWTDGNVTDEGKHNAMYKVTHPDDYIKCGDYVRVAVVVRGNKPAKSPGIYVNPVAVLKTRSGAAIATGGGNVTSSQAASIFGSGTPAPSAPSAPVATTPPPTPTQASAPPAPPAMDLVEPPVMYSYQGQTKTMEQWIASGWSKEQVETYCTK